MFKTIGYFIFAFVYYICRLFPLSDRKVLCVMTHDDGEDSNVSLVVRELKKHKDAYTFSYITKSETESVKSLKDIAKLISFFLIKPYHMARSKTILMDNVFLPMAYIRVKRKVKVIQLWHGTGTIKKFGQDVNTGRLKEQERRANRNITHLIVNNMQIAKLYAKAFSVDTDRVYPLGLPKTDDILVRKRRIDIENTNIEKDIIYKKYQIPKNKKLILYAPTFRDNNLASDTILLHVEEISKGLDKDYILGLRLHPFVASKSSKLNIDNVCDLSAEKSLSLLIMASDLLITDYSSIIFEYCITEKPIIFFAYDLDEFLYSGRGLYKDYASYVPGPIAYSSKELIDIINENSYSLDLIRNFISSNFQYLDGKASERIVELITS